MFSLQWIEGLHSRVVFARESTEIKNHPDGWLIFGFAFVAPALLPVI
jgi:hypothetical protein